MLHTFMKKINDVGEVKLTFVTENPKRGSHFFLTS